MCQLTGIEGRLADEVLQLPRSNINPFWLEIGSDNGWRNVSAGCIKRKTCRRGFRAATIQYYSFLKHIDGQTMLLQQALLNANNTMAQQQQVAASGIGQGPSNLHPFIRPTEAVRQAAMNGSNSEPNVSPRPIPLDPSPPRATSGGAATGEPTKEPLINVEDDKPTTSAAGPTHPHPLNPIGIANPLNAAASAAGFHNNSKTNTAVSGNGSPGSNVATPVLSMIQMSEDHYTETFRKNEQKRQQGLVNTNGQAGGSPKTDGVPDADERPPALAPILMMSYLNNCMSHAKTHLTANGVQVGVDDNGQVDAREDMKAKDVRNLEHHPGKRPFPGAVTSQPKSIFAKKSPSPQRHPGQSPHQTPSPMRQQINQNPIGINRPIPDTAPPKIEPETDRSPSEDLDDDGAKRLRIATDEE